MAMLLAADSDNQWDVVVSSNRIQQDLGLFTSVALSLFTNASATPEDLAAAGLPDDHPNGWWADAFPGIEGDAYGSKLWLLARGVVDSATLAQGKLYTEQALAWMIEDKVARSVTVSNFWLRSGHMVLSVAITRPDGTRWASVWNAATGEGAEVVA